MTRFLTLVPALLLVACFGSHGSDDGPSDDRPLTDGGVHRNDWGPGHDFGPRPVDGGPIGRDGGHAGPCSPRRADVTCGTAPHPSGIPFDLPVAIGGDGECYCGETVDCAVSVRPGPTGEPVELDLNTNICVGGALCDACFPYIEGSCRVPALPEGSYPVWMNGERAFDLEVEGADFIGQEQCTRVAAPDPLGCGPVSWPPQGFEPGEICHPESVFTGSRATITVVDTCASCGQQPGPCTVTVDESGFAPVLQVQTSRTYTACDVDCPAICMRMEHECVVPDTLAPETYHQVLVNGVNFGTGITTGMLGDPSEVCAGSAIGG
jgi:hypothetical protein